MSTTSVTPDKPGTPWSRRKDYLAAGIRCDEYGQRASCGDATTDRRKLRRALDRELRQLTQENTP